MIFLKFWTISVHLFYPEFKDFIIPSRTIYNSFMSEMLGRDLQVRKANNISWKINKKSSYRPSNLKRHA